ncbi:WhiB family transcriptional regulator [Lentzea sp. BCCO 10_0856]|uniref:WhiB family transcriptional regulator n=1 Tax=Lentzea miocenica TaxID=3095431 RepID=A0ABU4TFP5_9PSEU|nr:WhiB family transcriptional regulator [Lentzea sp. BCCO 10_0856]MDX8036991.1 WhiB family transcriptional regulator [Lentzea sp. BCCO 10_0856]
MTDLRLVGIAWSLDHLRWVPTDELTDVVQSDGLCMWAFTDEPPWADEELTDRELAERQCSGCPVRDECLELELRTAGAETVGVWGALPEDERREVHGHWLQRGERAERGPRS